MPRPAGTPLSVVEPEIHGDLDEAKLKMIFRARVLNRMSEKHPPWNASELARRSGLTRDLVSTYLRDPPRSLPTNMNLIKISQALGCEPGELLPSAADLTAHVPPLQVIGQDDQGFRVKINIPVSLGTFAEITKLIEREVDAATAARRRGQ